MGCLPTVLSPGVSYLLLQQPPTRIWLPNLISSSDHPQSCLDPHGHFSYRCGGISGERCQVKDVCEILDVTEKHSVMRCQRLMVFLAPHFQPRVLPDSPLHGQRSCSPSSCIRHLGTMWMLPFPAGHRALSMRGVSPVCLPVSPLCWLSDTASPWPPCLSTSPQWPCPHAR